MKQFLAVLHARNMEFLRDRSALAWNLAMPFLLVAGLAFTFSGNNKEIYKIGIVGGVEALGRVAPALQNTKHIQYVPYADLGVAIDKVKHHQMDMLIDVRSAPSWQGADAAVPLPNPPQPHPLSTFPPQAGESANESLREFHAKGISEWLTGWTPLQDWRWIPSR